MNKKLLGGLLKRFDLLLDEEEDIFFAERPFLEDPSLPRDKDNKYAPIIPSPKRSQNTLEKEKVLEAISKIIIQKLILKPLVVTQVSLLTQ